MFLKWTKHKQLINLFFLKPWSYNFHWVLVKKHIPCNRYLQEDLYDNFTENMINHNLEQMVKIPTRNNNILDLYLTNIPSQVHETKTLPRLGTSDHDIVFHEIKVKRGRIKQIPRQVKSYKKANWSDFRKDLAIFTNTFIAHKHEDPNHHWDMFKAEVNRLSTLHIPTR